MRDKGLNSLRQWIDEIDSGRFPGLYLLMTGTPAFYDGPHGMQRLTPLAQRLQVDFQTDARFDNPRAVQIRLPNFTQISLVQVGLRVRDIYIGGCKASQRISERVTDRFIERLATTLLGELGGKIGLAPRLFLRKLVSDILDRVDHFPDCNPEAHYTLNLTKHDLSEDGSETGSVEQLERLNLE